MKKLILGGMAALALSAAGASASAATNVIFDFVGSPGDQGQTHTYTVSGLSLTASAYGPALNNVADHLWGKTSGGDENGLGMTNDPTGDHEIDYGQGFIQLDLNALYGKVDPTRILFSMGSTSGGETWTVYGTNTAGVVGSAALPGAKSLILSRTNDEGNNYALTGGYRYYDFVSTSTAGGRNVLLHNVTVTPVPEPATWAVMLVGFAGMGAALRRRRAYRLVETFADGTTATEAFRAEDDASAVAQALEVATGAVLEIWRGETLVSRREAHGLAAA